MTCLEAYQYKAYSRDGSPNPTSSAFRRPEEEWPQTTSTTDENKVNLERRKTPVVGTASEHKRRSYKLHEVFKLEKIN